MANPLDPFGLGTRDPQRDPATGPPVPNMGGIPTTPLSPAANLNPFAIPPVVTPDTGGRPTEGAVGPSPVTNPPLTPTATAASVAPPTETTPAPDQTPHQEAVHDRNAHQGVTINIGADQKKPTSDASGSVAPTASGGAAPAAAQGPVAGLPPPIKLDRLPTAPEMNFAPPGSVFETHIGSMTRGLDGNWQIQPNELGVAKYKEAKVRAIQDFGSHPFTGDPNAPLPPVEPGQPWFNPFTSTWNE